MLICLQFRELPRFAEFQIPDDERTYRKVSASRYTNVKTEKMFKASSKGRVSLDYLVIVPICFDHLEEMAEHSLPTAGYCALCRAKELELYGDILNRPSKKHRAACEAAGCHHPSEY